MKGFYKKRMNPLCQKGHYPYEWVVIFFKEDDKGLPPNFKFYSKLKQELITEEEYTARIKSI